MPLLKNEKKAQSKDNIDLVPSGPKSDSSSDEQEEMFKNIISSKGKFASFLLEKNAAANTSIYQTQGYEGSKSFIKPINNKALVLYKNI